MRKSGIRIAVAVTALMVTEAGAAQQSKPKPHFAWTCLPDPKRHVPYSAEFNLTNTYPGSDGNLVVYNYWETQALDSHGRSLGTTTFPDPNHKGPPQTTGVACDPPTNTQYRWNSLTKQIIVLKMPKLEESKGCWESESGDLFVDFDTARRLAAEAEARTRQIDQMARDPDNPDPLVEDLGTMTLQGVEVQGTRTIRPPATSSTDPEPPYLREEHWASPLLGVWLQQEVDYPPSTKHNIKWSRRVTNLNLSDPAPSTFEPPRDYKVVTEAMHQVPCEAQIEHSDPQSAKRNK